MQEERKSQASGSRSRPAGTQRPACPEGVRRPGGGSSNVSPAPPLVPSQSREVCGLVMEVKDWGVQRPQESVSDFASRIAYFMYAFKMKGKELCKLREELKCARVRANSASGNKRAEANKEITRLRSEINLIEKVKMDIQTNSGLFLEKLQNQERFDQMKGLSQQSDSMERAEEDGVSDLTQDTTQGSQSGICPGQLPPASASGSRRGSGGDSSDSGGRLMAVIREMESPVHLQHFTFGEDPVPDEEERRRRRSSDKKRGESVSFTYVPLSPAPPSQSPAVGSVQGASSGQSMEVPTAALRDTVSVCSSGKSVGAISAVKPDIVGEVGSPAGGGFSSASGQGMSGKGTALVPMPEIRSEDGDKRRHGALIGKAGSAVGPDAGAVSAVGVSPAGASHGRTSSAGGAGVTAAGIIKPAKAGLAMAAAKAVKNLKGALNPTGTGHSAAKAVENLKGALNPMGTGHSAAGKVIKTVSVPGRPPAPAEDFPVTREAEGVPDKKSEAVIAEQDLSGSPKEAEVTSVNSVNSGQLSVASGPGLNGGVNGGEGVREDGKDHERMDGGDVSVSGGEGVREADERMDGGDVSGGECMDAVESDARVVGPSEPPVAAASRSYASVAAGSHRPRVSAAPSGPGNSDLQRRFLEALRRGDTSITVEGREVELSFWIERHGLGAFREQRRGEESWSLPTAGSGVTRRNVVRLRWRGSDTCPDRTKVVELLLKMDFRVGDIFALIHPHGTPFFDVSFVRAEGLELFWSRYELAKIEPEWQDFVVQAISRQNNIKKVTVLTCNESLSCIDIMTWIGRYGEVVSIPQKNRDDFGIWSGAWTFMVKLKVSGNSVTHIPSSTFLGRDRILVFYQGQPKVCHRCGDPTHFSAQCRVQKCALCGGIGHLAATCVDIRCHLCGDLGHPFSRCPVSFANAVETPAGVSREADSTGEGTSRGGEATGPRKKKMTSSKLRRMEARQRAREGAPQVAAEVAIPDPEMVDTAEDLRDGELEEEVRRLDREEEEEDDKRATTATSSPGESMDEESKEWLKNKRKSGARKKRRKKEKASSSLEWDNSVPLSLVQVPAEGSAGSPLVDSPNRYQVLGDNISSSDKEAEDEGPVSEVRSLGSVKPSSLVTGGAAVPGPCEVQKVTSGKEEKTPVNMDMSVCLKRGKVGKSDDDTKDTEGGGKKRAV